MDTHQRFHKFVEFQQTVGAADARNLIVLLDAVSFDATMPDEERYGLTNMDPLFDGCQVVGQYGYADILIFYLIIYRGDETLIEILDGLQFQFEVAIMTSLVAGLYMDKDKVAPCTLTMRRPAYLPMPCIRSTALITAPLLISGYCCMRVCMEGR